MQKIKLERGANLYKASSYLEDLPGEGSWAQTKDREYRYRNLEQQQDLQLWTVKPSLLKIYI